MSTSCTACKRAFDITQDDLNFLDKLSPVIGDKKFPLSPPTRCIECRQQRRIAQFNQLNLYKRKCDFTHEEVISNFHSDSPHKVYKQEIWYSDQWDPLSFGRDFDFSRPFFEQFHELSLAVPRPSLFTGYQYDENSEYTNHAGKNKNCYLIFDSDENRDCYYSYSLNGSENCADCFRVRKSQLTYQCIDSLNCYNSAYLQDCDNCMDSMFLKNCVSCKNCLMSSNLRNKEFYVENKKVSKTDFEKIKKMLTSHSRIDGAKERFNKLKLEHPQKYMHGINNENVVGDYLTNSKNAYHCFDSSDLWDCRYIFQAFNPLKDSMDIQECGDSEKLYECCVMGYGVQNCLFSHHTLGNATDMLYSSYCPHSTNMFGCIGLRHKRYCVFNKQYTKEQYEEIVPKIIGHMIKTKEWGEFFPIKDAQCAYNETLAQYYCPLTKEQALAKGLMWRDEDVKQYKPATTNIPDSIVDVQDSITNETLACEECKKNYRVIPQELALHRQLQLPLSKRCFDCRMKAIRNMRNPRTLLDRKCSKCAKDVQTTYAKDRPEKILCEECYLTEVY